MCYCEKHKCGMVTKNDWRVERVNVSYYCLFLSHRGEHRGRRRTRSKGGNRGMKTRWCQKMGVARSDMAPTGTSTSTRRPKSSIGNEQLALSLLLRALKQSKPTSQMTSIFHSYPWHDKGVCDACKYHYQYHTHSGSTNIVVK